MCLAHLTKGCRRDALGLRDEHCCASPMMQVRRSELIAIDVAHVEGPVAEGVGIVHIPLSKTDQAKEGAEAYLLPATMAAIVGAKWAASPTVRCCAGW